MKKITAVLFCCTALAVSACGPNTATRATTGAATGAVVAGPVGAVAGAALGGSGTVRVE
ncbi:hypothetical protein [Paracoccus aerodenitrificans]|uniref:hypothetical protein n=1 Tax=Paracoccus aerodenitrificans TaxID=3017781 RepID=UPI0022F0C661|nr:hypothetical protein [Paracoccus aerodenitrificans]WBU64094.1 hypothetical protein PAE61_17495 [Paracoccus aerodenitrificans]